MIVKRIEHKCKMKENCKIQLDRDDKPVVNLTRFANALENSILSYGNKHSDFIVNPYWHFSQKLGYKSKNYLYKMFQTKEKFRMPISDIMYICLTTKDFTPIEILTNNKNVINVKNWKLE